MSRNRGKASSRGTGVTPSVSAARHVTTVRSWAAGHLEARPSRTASYRALSVRGPVTRDQITKPPIAIAMSDQIGAYGRNMK